MTQILGRLPDGYVHQILCYYINDDSKIKIARINNIPNHCFERVVFPGEQLLFEAIPEAQLEIYISRFPTDTSNVLVEVITCDRLAVKTAQHEEKPIVQQREKVESERQPEALWKQSRESFT